MQALSHGQGLIPARIMLVGEAWGSSEDIAKAPFVGASGQELNRMLHDAKILRSDCYATNVVNARPLNNDISHWVKRKKKDVSPTDVPYRDAWVDPIILAGIDQLRGEVSLVKPNVIIAFGNTALWALTGLWGVTRQRGSQLHTDDEFGIPAKVIPTIHPAAVLCEWGWRQIAVNDLRRAKRFENVAGPLYGNEPAWNFILRPNLNDALGTIAKLHLTATGSPTPLWLDVDIETRGNNIACLGIGWSRTEAICIPFMCVESDAGYWSLDEEVAVVLAARDLLTHPNVRVRWQNGLFDAQYLYRYWLFIPNHGQDTMISHHVMYAGLRKALDFQASMYCDYYRFWKDDGKTWDRSMGEEQLWSYNCEDCVRTREVGEVEQAAIPRMNLEYAEQFQQRLWRAVLRMMNRGIRVDLEKRESFSLDLLEEMSAREAWFHHVLGHPLNPSSSPQMLKLFYEDLGQKPIMSRPTKASPSHPTCNDEALEILKHREPLLRPLLRRISEYRSLGVFLSTFVQAALDVDGRLRCSFNICGTETYRFASSKNAFGSGCVPAEAEVLTPNGWKRIDGVVEGEVIAQWSPSGEISFAPAIPYSTDYSGTMHRGVGEQFDVNLTSGHRVVYFDKYLGASREAPASSVSKMSSICLPLGGRYFGNVKLEYPRLLVAALADGSYEGGLVRLAFKKERKIDRITHLLNSYGIDWWENTARPGYRRFVFRRPASWPEQKAWGWWVLGLVEEQREEVLDELQYWDSHSRGKSFMFFTADIVQAEIIATLAHMTSRSATIRKTLQSEGSYSDTPMWIVNVKPRWYARLRAEHWYDYQYQGKVYCVTVPTSYFLMRYNGMISITGNTNFQNIPKGGEDDDSDLRLPNIREMFIPDPGMTFYDIDLSKADLRIVVWESNCREMKAMLNEGRDPYIEIAREFYRDPTISKKLPSGGENPKYRLFKSFAHGTHYLGTPQGLARRLGLTVHEADRTQRWYFERNPEIRAWQNEFVRTLNRTRKVRNVFGFERYYFDRVDDSTAREAIAWLPQSTVAIYINHILVALDENARLVQPLLQVHDSLPGQFPTAQREAAIAELRSAANITLPYDDPLVIPIDIKTSEVSWGDCE